MGRVSPLPGEAPPAANEMEATASAFAQLRGGERQNQALVNSSMKETDKYIEVPATEPKRKKNKGKSAASRGCTALPKSRGTGFEEGYADPPLTPEEYSEEQQLYASHRPFPERIEECIQRYRARRRLDSERNNFFTMYLLLGGIDATPRMFTGGTGIDRADIEGATRSELISMSARDVIVRSGGASRFYNPRDSDHWDVDFYGVAAGFLSHHLPFNVGGDMEIINQGIDVVENFLNYVRQHDVCPEYNENVDKARACCARARVELPKCYNANCAMPGDFNLACHKLFSKPKKNQKTLDPNAEMDLQVPDDFDAERVFKTTIALWRDLAGAEAYKMAANHMSDIKATSTREMTLEVDWLPPLGAEKINQYAGVKNQAGMQGKVKPVGSAVFKHCFIEEGWDYPRPTEEEPNARSRELFFLEKNILDSLDNGFKLRVVVCELNCDIKFIKEVIDVFPSFYTFLPQELMFGYKEPVDNERPAPSVNNPIFEEDEEADGLKLD